MSATDDEIDPYFAKFRVVPTNISVYLKQKDLAQFIEEAFLLLSLSGMDLCQDTFSLMILERMAAGLPCIGPPISGPVELVDENINGFFVASHDTQQIAKHLNFYAKIQTGGLNPWPCRSPGLRILLKIVLN